MKAINSLLGWCDYGKKHQPFLSSIERDEIASFSNYYKIFKQIKPNTTAMRHLDLFGNYITDGGLETTLIFLNGIDLPHFASFELLNTYEGRKILKDSMT